MEWEDVQPCFFLDSSATTLSSYYNQTLCLTNCNLPFASDWVSAWKTEDHVKTKDAKCNSIFVKAPWRNDTDALSLELCQTLSLKTHIIPKRFEFYYNMKSSTLMFFCWIFFVFFLFKWYVTRRNKNSKSDQTIPNTNDTLYISPSTRRGPRRKFE